jgi:hypothetical protein
MTHGPKIPQDLEGAIATIKKLFSATSEYEKKPCSAKINDDPCADQNLPFEQFCSNCKNAWTNISHIGGQTPEEALDFVRAKKKERKETDERLHALLNTPCLNANVYGHCADQDRKFADMCPNCAEYWALAGNNEGMPPDEVISTTKKISEKLLEEMQNAGKAN